MPIFDKRILWEKNIPKNTILGGRIFGEGVRESYSPHLSEDFRASKGATKILCKKLD